MSDKPRAWGGARIEWGDPAVFPIEDLFPGTPNEPPPLNLRMCVTAVFDGDTLTYLDKKGRIKKRKVKR